MKNWLIGIFSFRNKAVKKITRYQKQESMPEIESPKNTDRPPEPDFLNTNTRLQLLSQRKKNTRNATRSWACCCLRSTSTWSAWWTASGSCYWFLFDILIVWPFWLFFEVLWLSDPYILPSFFCEFELKERNGAKKWHGYKGVLENFMIFYEEPLNLKSFCSNPHHLWQFWLKFRFNLNLI